MVVNPTSERKGCSGEGSWEEKHLGHFIIWDRSAPSMSDQWGSEAKHNASSKGLLQQVFLCYPTGLSLQFLLHSILYVTTDGIKDFSIRAHPP